MSSLHPLQRSVVPTDVVSGHSMGGGHGTGEPDGAEDVGNDAEDGVLDDHGYLLGLVLPSGGCLPPVWHRGEGRESHYRGVTMPT
jgi:hypothetical protein